MAIYPIMLRPMVAPILNAPTLTNKKVFFSVASICIVAATGITAIWVTDIGQLNVVNGAFSCGVFISTIPGVVGLRMLNRDGTAWRVGMFVLLVCGMVMALVGLVFQDNYVDKLAALIKPTKLPATWSVDGFTERCLVGISD